MVNDESLGKDHFDLVWAGLALHEDFKYAEALEMFKQAES